jgi:hypothetical protein
LRSKGPRALAWCALVAAILPLGCGRGDDVEPIFPHPPAIRFDDEVLAVAPPSTFEEMPGGGGYALGTHTASREERSALALLIRPVPAPDAHAFVVALETHSHRVMGRALPPVQGTSTDVLAVDIAAFLGLPYEEVELDVFVWDRAGITPLRHVSVPMNRRREGRLPMGVTGATWFRDPIEGRVAQDAPLMLEASTDRPGNVTGALVVDDAAHEAPLLVLVRAGSDFAWGRNPLPAGVRGRVPLYLDARDLFRSGHGPDGPSSVVALHAERFSRVVVVEIPTAGELVAVP